MKRAALLLTLIACSTVVSARQINTTIELHYKGIKDQNIRLVYRLGKQAFIADQDTLRDGMIKFSGEYPVGSYNVYFENDANFAIMVNEPKIVLKSNDDNITTYEVIESKENQAYIPFNNEYWDLEGEEQESYRAKFVESNEGLLVAKMIQTLDPLKVDCPDNLSEQECKRQGYKYRQEHYFDFFDPGDEDLLYTPIYDSKIGAYIKYYVAQDAESVSAGIDHVLSKTSRDNRTFQYVLMKFINEFAKDERMGMDAVYVHLVEKYYCSQKRAADWISAEKAEEMCAKADRMKPLLLGKTAPNIILQTPNFVNEPGGGVKALHAIVSDYTYVVFWNTKDETSRNFVGSLTDQQELMKQRGITMYAVVTDEIPYAQGLINSADKLKWEWINVGEFKVKSSFRTDYNLSNGLPQMYLLDKDKKIIGKSIDINNCIKLIDWLEQNK